MDWIGNFLIVIGLWFIGNKKRWAFLFSIAGETAWIIYSLSIGLYSLAIICLIFALLATRSWLKWGTKSVESFNDRDIQYIWNRINPEFYGMILETIGETTADGVIKADGVKIHEANFKRMIKLIVNDRIKEKQDEV